MKQVLVITALLAISARSEPAPAPEADASVAAEAPAPAETNIAADGKSSVGTFKITNSKGEVYIEEDKADGTYEGKTDGKTSETGKWVQKSPSVFCYTKDEKVPKEVCNEEKVENGVWTSKNPDGKVSTVERVAG